MVPDPDKNVLVRDESGNELELPYAALSFAMSEAGDGKCTILIVFDGDFELGGTEQRLFQDAATHVLTTLLGRIPSAVESYALVPARMAEGVRTRPIFDLPAVWSARASSTLAE
jgi:hypothetical protein